MRGSVAGLLVLVLALWPLVYQFHLTARLAADRAGSSGQSCCASEQCTAESSSSLIPPWAWGWRKNAPQACPVCRAMDTFLGETGPPALDPAPRLLALAVAEPNPPAPTALPAPAGLARAPPVAA